MIRLSAIERFSGSLSGPVGSARAPLSERSGLVITLIDARGSTGVGEASPLPGTSLETIDDAFAILDALRRLLDDSDSSLVRTLRDHQESSELSPESARALVNVVEKSLIQGSDGLPGHRRALPGSVRFALETALGDLASKAQGSSLARWLSEGSARPWMARSVLVGALSLPDFMGRALGEIARGARTIKVKVRGEHPESEARQLIELRRAVSQGGASSGEIAIRVDLNGALEVEAARRALRAYKEAEVELCEEPVSGDRLLSLGETAVPWFADESLVDSALRARLLDDPRCAGVVLKPTLLGLLDARALALEAVRKGKAVIVTHAFDGPVALAAACGLALSVPGSPSAAGIDLHGAASIFPKVSVPQLAETGSVLGISDSGLPGLGIDWPGAAA